METTRECKDYLRLWVLWQQSQEEIDAVIAHIASCKVCRVQLPRLMAGPVLESSPDALPQAMDNFVQIARAQGMKQARQKPTKKTCGQAEVSPWQYVVGIAMLLGQLGRRLAERIRRVPAWAWGVTSMALLVMWLTIDIWVGKRPIPFDTIQTHASEAPITLLVLHDEQPLKEEPTLEQIQAFRDRYRNLYISNSDEELVKLLPRTLVREEKREAILDEILEYTRQRRVNIHIKFVSWQGAFRSLDDVLRNRVTSPDIVMMPTTWCTHFTKEGLLEPLNQFIKRDQINIENLYTEEVIKPCREPNSEEPYGLPGTVDARLLYVWKGIQNPISNKIDIVIANPRAVITNTAAFQEALKTLPDKFNTQIKRINAEIRIHNERHREKTISFIPEVQKAFVLPNAPKDFAKLHNFAMFVWTFGGELFAPRRLFFRTFHEATFNDPDVVHYMLMIAPYTDIGEITLAQAEQRFLERRYLTHLGVPNTVRRAREELGDDWEKLIEVIPLPAGPVGNRSNFLGGTHWAITTQAAKRGNLEAAWGLVKFLTLDTESQKRYALEAGHLPAPKDAFREFLKDRPEYKPFDKALSDGRGFPRLAAWASIVENEFTLDQLYQFWRLVGFRRAQEARITLDNAANWLTDKLFHNPVSQIRKQTGTTILFFIGLGAAIIIISIKTSKLRKEQKVRAELETQLRRRELDLRGVQAEKAALQKTEPIMRAILERLPEEHEGSEAKKSPISEIELVELQKEIEQTDDIIGKLMREIEETKHKLGNI